MNISERMKRIRSTQTKPEILLRKALWNKGYRYRINEGKLPGRPDIVFPKHRVVVFVDGDFWHGNQWKKRKKQGVYQQFPVEKQGYWVKKIKNNRDRDVSSTEKLLSLGWKVIRLWESDIMRDLEGCVNQTLHALNSNGKNRRQLPSRTVLEFFAGIGLMRLGLEQSGWNVVFANDVDPLKLEMYEKNFSTDEFRLCDICELRACELPRATLATASFPCTDLSLAGSRNGLHGTQSSTFWTFVDLMKQMGDQKPPLVLIENVPGFITSHGGKDLEAALTALNNLGYRIDACMIDAAEFVPQSRLRLFIIGKHKSLSEPEELRETSRFYGSKLRPKLLAQFIFEHPNINWDLRELPPIPARQLQLKDMLENLSEDDSRWWSRERSEYLLNQMSEGHRRTMQQMIDKKWWSFGTVFRRIRKGKSMAELRTDGIAGCLRTPKGGSARQILVKAGYGRFHVRLLTPRECARLMGADDFIIDVAPNNALYGFGDAVCVPVIHWLADNYLSEIVAENIRVSPLNGYKVG